jgi:hypothetical protein
LNSVTVASRDDEARLFAAHGASKKPMLKVFAFFIKNSFMV